MVRATPDIPEMPSGNPLEAPRHWLPQSRCRRFGVAECELSASVQDFGVFRDGVRCWRFQGTVAGHGGAHEAAEQVWGAEGLDGIPNSSSGLPSRPHKNPAQHGFPGNWPRARNRLIRPKSTNQPMSFDRLCKVTRAWNWPDCTFSPLGTLLC